MRQKRKDIAAKLEMVMGYCLSIKPIVFAKTAAGEDAFVPSDREIEAAAIGIGYGAALGSIMVMEPYGPDDPSSITAMQADDTFIRTLSACVDKLEERHDGGGAVRDDG